MLEDLPPLPPPFVAPKKSKRKKKKRTFVEEEKDARKDAGLEIVGPDATAMAQEMFDQLFVRDAAKTAKRKKEAELAKREEAAAREDDSGGKGKKVKRKKKNKGLVTKGDLIIKRPAAAPSPKAKATISGVPPLGCSKCRFLKYGCTDCRIRRDKQIAKMGIADPLLG